MKQGRTTSRRMPRQMRSEESRAQILLAAERIFAKSGLAGARTDAIAREAKVNKALLYYYFPSKDHLYEAVVENHFREFNQRALEVLKSKGSARDVLLQYVSMHFDFVSEQHRHATLYQQMMMTGGKALERLVPKYFAPRSKALGELLQRGIRGGEFRKMDRFQASVSVVALIVFYFSASQVIRLMGHSDAFDPAKLRLRKKELLDLIRFGLFKHPNRQ